MAELHTDLGEQERGVDRGVTPLRPGPDLSDPVLPVGLSQRTLDGLLGQGREWQLASLCLAVQGVR